MGIVTAISQLALWIWFLGCTITYKTKKFLLVEGMGIKSAEFVMLCLYSIALASYYFLHSGKWILFGLLVLWAAVQFMCHWRYTIFGVSEKKLTGYNECFQNTVRLIPASTSRLVPDLYHVVLHIMIIINQESDSVRHLLEQAGLRKEPLQKKDGRFHIQCKKESVDPQLNEITDAIGDVI